MRTFAKLIVLWKDSSVQNPFWQKIWHAESLRFFQAKRFSTLNLFVQSKNPSAKLSCTPSSLTSSIPGAFPSKARWDSHETQLTNTMYLINSKSTTTHWNWLRLLLPELWLQVPFQPLFQYIHFVMCVSPFPTGYETLTATPCCHIHSGSESPHTSSSHSMLFADHIHCTTHCPSPHFRICCHCRIHCTCSCIHCTRSQSTLAFIAYPSTHHICCDQCQGCLSMIILWITS